MTKQLIRFELNGMPVDAVASGGLRLLDLLREGLDQIGTKEGCGEGECGACTVLVDGRAVNSCLYPALEIENRKVTTIEGLRGANNALSAVQRAFVDECGAQCGFCTPGMIMTATALLTETPNPTEGEVRDALTGNLCRCTGYVQIVRSIRRAAELTQQEGSA